LATLLLESHVFYIPPEIESTNTIYNYNVTLKYRKNVYKLISRKNKQAYPNKFDEGIEDMSSIW